MAAPEYMEAETLQAPDSAHKTQKDEIGPRGAEASPAMEGERLLESTTDTADERPQVEGRRRTVSDDQAPNVPGGAGGQDGDTSKQQPVRRQPSNEESVCPSETIRTWKGALWSGVQAGKKKVV